MISSTRIAKNQNASFKKIEIINLKLTSSDNPFNKISDTKKLNP